jgi:hypothetical protein
MVIKFPATATRKHVICGRGLDEYGRCSEHDFGVGMDKAESFGGSVNEAIRNLTTRRETP